MGKGIIVERLTRKALERGRARSGPWEVTASRDLSETRLYHYGHQVALGANGFISTRPREGHGLSLSDVEGIRAFARATQTPAPPGLRATYRAYAGGQSYPRRGGPEAQELLRRSEEHGNALRAAAQTAREQAWGNRRMTVSHLHAHSRPSHHIGECSEGCRRGAIVGHSHRMTARRYFAQFAEGRVKV